MDFSMSICEPDKYRLNDSNVTISNRLFLLNRSVAKDIKEPDFSFSQLPLTELTTTTKLPDIEKDDEFDVFVQLSFEFMEATQAFPMRHMQHDLVNCYIERLSIMINSLRHLSNPKYYGANSRHFGFYLELVEQERFVWQLLHNYYQERLQDGQDNGQSVGDLPQSLDVDDGMLSDKEIVDAFFQRDKTIRQAQIALETLEQFEGESENFHLLLQRAQLVQCHHDGTRNFLQRERLTLSAANTTVNELDPDAPWRLNRQWHPSDLADEDSFSEILFVMLRAGKFEEAREFCIQAGKSWKAATLEGWKHYHDSNYHVLKEGSMAPAEMMAKNLEGNLYRKLWLECAWSKSSDVSVPRYERAIYGCLCGNLDAMLTVCNTWEDYLWAFLHYFTHWRVENELQQYSQGGEEPFSTSKPEHGKDMTLSNVFDRLESSSNEDVRCGAKMPFNIIKKYVILNYIGLLLQSIADFLSSSPAQSKRPVEGMNQTQFTQQYLPRFAAHLVLYLHNLQLIDYNVTNSDSSALNLLQVYIRELAADSQRHRMVPFYVSLLPDPLRSDTFVSFLFGLPDNTLRMEMLSIGSAFDLNVPLMAQLLFERIRLSDTFGELGQTFSGLSLDDAVHDRAKIEAIELLFYVELTAQAILGECNALMRQFLSQKKFDAIRQVVEKVEGIVQRAQSEDAESEVSAQLELANEVKECVSMRMCVEAVSAYGSWHGLLCKGRPKGRGGWERQGGEAADEEQVRRAVALWEARLAALADAAVRALTQLITQPGGWLRDSVQLPSSNVRHVDRQRQLLSLRQAILPSSVDLLYDVFYQSEHFDQCLRIADLLVDTRWNVVDSFSETQLKQLLLKLKDASLSILKANIGVVGQGDSLGY